jgi:hypothetical protein
VVSFGSLHAEVELTLKNIRKEGFKHPCLPFLFPCVGVKWVAEQFSVFNPYPYDRNGYLT